MRGALLLQRVEVDQMVQPCHGVAINEFTELREVQNMRFLISFSRKCNKVFCKKKKSVSPG